MSVAVYLLNLITGEHTPCPLPSDTPYRFVSALGNFDGVHLAHRRLLTQTIEIAKQRTGLGSPAVAAAFCFATPSGDYFSEKPQHLTTLSEKLALFAACGLRYAFIADFPSLRNLSPEQFINEILICHCATDAVVCGYNFHFGQNGQGDCNTLQQHFGENCTVLPRVDINLNGTPATVSSSAVRSLLLSGDCTAAAKMLCRPYALTAPVVHGKRLARSLGLPTANMLFPPKKLVPQHGVYAVRCFVDGKEYFGVSNVGYRPTVDGSDAILNCETHILGFAGDLYDKEITVNFCHKLRGEKRFDDIAALKAAILADIDAALAYFNASPTKVNDCIT